MGTTTTPNLGLIKPDGAELARNWPTQVGANYDILDAALQTFGTYIPTLSATGANPVLGAEGYINGRWHRTGKMVTAWGDTQLKGTGADLGGSSWRVSLPFSADATFHSIGILSAPSDQIGSAKFALEGVPTGPLCAVILSNPAEIIFYAHDDDGSVGGQDINLFCIFKWTCQYLAVTA